MRSGGHARGCLEYCNSEGCRPIGSGAKSTMETVITTLLAATDDAVRSNDGFRTVSAIPTVEKGDPIAAITLLGPGGFKIVIERLN
jgi:hypothetical protein